jgi:hypothetical protein
VVIWRRAQMVLLSPQGITNLVWVVFAGGARETRTPDPLLANRSRLSDTAAHLGCCPGRVRWVGPCRMLLWSGLVVSAHKPGLSSEAKLIDRHTGPVRG